MNFCLERALEEDVSCEQGVAGQEYLHAYRAAVKAFLKETEKMWT